MRFLQIKSAEQQGRLMLHRTRDLLMRQRTQVINALRAHLAELGIVAPQGRQGVKELLMIIASEEDERLPVDAHASLVVLAAEFTAMQTMIGSIEKRIMARHSALGAAQNCAENSEDDDTFNGGGRRKLPKEMSLTERQAAWVARKNTDPFFAYDAKYLIDNKAGIIVDAEGTRANRVVEIAVTRTIPDRVGRRFQGRILLVVVARAADIRGGG